MLFFFNFHNAGFCSFLVLDFCIFRLNVSKLNKKNEKRMKKVNIEQSCIYFYPFRLQNDVVSMGLTKIPVNEESVDSTRPILKMIRMINDCCVRWSQDKRVRAHTEISKHTTTKNYYAVVTNTK